MLIIPSYSFAEVWGTWPAVVIKSYFTQFRKSSASIFSIREGIYPRLIQFDWHGFCS